MEFKFSSDTRHLKHLELSREALKHLHVDIGLQSSASPRNRWLLALHERGAPGAHIPPRPVVAPALSQPGTQSAIQSGLLSACEAASEGDAAGVQSGFERAGEAGVEGIRSYIDAGVPPPNAPLTVHGGWIRNFSSGRPVHVEGKGSNKPLYDTGELYHSFSFEVISD